MSQYCIHKNISSGKKNYPFLLDVQSNLLSNLNTRLVIPLSPVGSFNNQLIKNVNISIRIQNKDYILLTQQMAAIPEHMLGDEVVCCEEQRHDILGCIDFLITGF
jgi:toxin CcdB